MLHIDRGERAHNLFMDVFILLIDFSISIFIIAVLDNSFNVSTLFLRGSENKQKVYCMTED